MATNGDRFHWRDILAESLEDGSEIAGISSSQAGSFCGPMAPVQRYGSAEYRLQGSYNNAAAGDGRMKITAVGSARASLSGVVGIPTRAIKDPRNVGNGAVTIKATANTKKSFNINMEVKGTGVSGGCSAWCQSDDREQAAAAGDDKPTGGCYINARTGEEQDKGNYDVGTDRKYIQIAKKTPWLEADSGATLARNHYAGEYVIKLNKDPGIAVETLGYITLNNQCYAYYLDVAANYIYAYIWPRLRENLSSGTKLYLVGSSGFTITCVDTGGTSHVYHKTAANGFILTLGDIAKVLAEGGLDGSGNPIAACGYRMMVDSDDPEQYFYGSPVQPPKAEKMTFDGGTASSTYNRFFVTIRGDFNQQGTSAFVLADGSDHTLFSGQAYEFVLKFVEGTTPWKTDKDRFTAAMVQAQMGVTWDDWLTSTTYDIYDSTGYSYRAKVTITHGLVIQAQTKDDLTPFVLNDEFRFTAAFKYSYLKLADSSRFAIWRTRRAAKQCLMFDAGAGNTYSANCLAVCDHNLNTSGYIYVHALQTNIAKCYGTVSSIAGKTVETGLTFVNNELVGGTLIFASGADLGLNFSITANDTDGTITLDPAGSTPTASAGDIWLIIPPAGLISHTYSAAVSDADYFTLTWTAYAARGWIIEFYDSECDDPYYEMSYCRLGQSLIPADADGNQEFHDQDTSPETDVGYDQAVASAIGEERQSAGFLEQFSIPIIFSNIDITASKAYDDLYSMVRYCKCFDRRRTLMWWKDSSAQDFVVGWIDKGYRFTPFKTHGEVELALRTLER